jgi:ATP-binding cassette subfamily F protein 3
MLVRPAALLCLDEPTNHLDLASKEVLETALAGFTGTIVFISHDRYFINRIATQVVEVDRGRLTTHVGDYDDYLARKSRPATPEPKAHAPKKRAPAAPPQPARRRLKAAVQKEIRAIKERLAAVEAQIHQLEARLAEIGLALADPDLYRDGERAREVAQSRRETEERVAWLMKEWEDLSLRLGAVSEEP